MLQKIINLPKGIRITIGLLFLIIGLINGLDAQSVLDKKIDFSINNQNLEEALFELSIASGVNISFANLSSISKLKINESYGNKSIKYILQDLLKKTDLSYRLIGGQVVLFVRPKEEYIPKYTIRGYLEDNYNGEKLIAANVYDPQSYRGTSTNLYGFYSLTLPKGKTKLSYSYLGYETQTIELDLNQDTLINISLKGALTLAEVVVISRDTISSDKFGRISNDEIGLQQVKKLPSLAGETDVVRTSFLLPGVQSGGDGVGGLFVRGGNADQNLILLDGVPVYNATHLVGVFSIFNSSAIRSASLIKGSFPARYGGRLSSVLDVRTKEGNKKQWEAEFGLGVVSSRFSLEGPIQKDKSSFFISFRRSFLDRIMKPFTRNFNQRNGVDGFSTYAYDDLNAKINFELSDKNEFFLSLYSGGDDFVDNRIESLLQFTYKTEQLLNWGNNIASFRWNHEFGKKLFSNTTATFSRYNFSSQSFTGLKDESIDSTAQSFFFANQYQSAIEDLAVKLDFDFFPTPAHYIRFGTNFTRHKFQPRVASVNQNNDIGFVFESDISELDQLFDDAFIEAFEGSLYFEDEFVVRKELRLNIGFHGSYFREREKTYLSLQPRLSAQFFIKNDWAFNLSFSTMRQHLHLLTRSGIGLPADLWVASNDEIKPQDSWQGVLGIKYAGKRNIWQAGLEAYYKKMNNVLAYQEGTLFNFIDSENWEDNVAVGEGWAYGLEFFSSKTKGKTTGMMSATLAWSQRQFDDISSGQRFDFRYDRRWFIKTAAIHRHSPGFEISASWVFGTGNGITLPTSVTEYYPKQINFSFADPLFSPLDNPANQSPFLVYQYGERNGYRMEAYHRFDFGFNFYINKNWGTQKISAGVYNLYNRKNPLFINLQPSNNDPNQRVFVKYSLIPLLPQISYLINLKNWKKETSIETLEGGARF